MAGNLFEWAKAKGYLQASDNTQFYTDPATYTPGLIDYVNFIKQMDARISNPADRLKFYQGLVDMGAIGGQASYWADRKYSGDVGDNLDHVANIAGQAFFGLAADPGALTGGFPSTSTPTTSSSPTTTPPPSQPGPGPGPGTGPGPGPSPGPDPEPVPIRNFFQDAKTLFPWLPDQLLRIYSGAWESSGDSSLAWATMQTSSAYEQYFPGNTRSDGSLVMSEQAYLSTIESYNLDLLSYNLNPGLFTAGFANLIQGGVSASEFSNRLETAYEEIIAQIPQIKAEFSRFYNIGFTDEAIFASFLDPEIGNGILDRRIAVSQVGGQAAVRGFSLSLSQAELYTGVGLLGGSNAGAYFNQAANAIPILNQVAGRFGVDTSVDLSEYSQDQLFGDPEQRRRFRRLLAQESSSFTEQGFAAQDAPNRVTGISAR